MKLTKLLFSLITAVPALLAQTDDVSAPPIVLPKIEVNGPALPPDNEHWNYVNLDGVEVLASTSVGNARSMLTAFQEFRHSLKIIYPTAMLRADQRLSLLLCRAQGFSSFLPAGAIEAGTDFSRLASSSERAFIIVDLDADKRAHDLLEFSSVDPYRQLNGQYLRYLFSTVNARVPLWLEEGLLQTISDMDYREKWLTLGKVHTNQNMPDGEQPTIGIPDFLAPNSSVSGLTFNQVFAHQRMMPLAQFFEAKTADGLNPASDSAWAKQAYAFVHFCMFGNKLRYRAPLATFVDRLQREPLSEELFRACFRVTFAEMQDQLRGYILRTAHKYQKYLLPPEQRLPSFTVEFRRASTTEVAMIKGEALQVAGRTELALQAYRSAYGQGLHNADFLSAFANSLNAVGDINRARQLVDAAAQGGSSRPSAYVLQARFRLDTCLAAPSGADGKLSDRQLASVLEPLFRARKLHPPIPQTYDLIAEAWSKSEVLPSKENLLVLDEGIQRFPKQSQLLVRSFHLYCAIGEKQKAASIAKLGLRLASEQSTRAMFGQLLESVENTTGHG